MNRRTWTPDDVQYIRDQAGKVPAAEIAAHLGRSLDSLYAKARTVKVDPDDPESPTGVSLKLEAVEGTIWSDVEVEVLVSNAADKTTQEIADLLPGRTRDAVRAEARRRSIRVKVDPPDFGVVDKLWARIPDGDQESVRDALVEIAAHILTSRDDDKPLTKGEVIVWAISYARDQLDAASDNYWDKRSRSYDDR